MDSSDSKIMDRIVKLVEDALSKFGNLFSLRFQGDKDAEDFSEFVKKEGTRFNPDGTLTEEYQEWIEKMEGKLTGKELDEMLINSAESAEEADAIRSIIGFVEDRGELMKDYRDTVQFDYDGDANAWVNDRATEGLNEAEKEKRLKKMDEILGAGDDIIVEQDEPNSEEDIIE